MGGNGLKTNTFSLFIAEYQTSWKETEALFKKKKKKS